MDDFGQRVWILGMSLQGSKSEGEWRTFLFEATRFLGMDPAGLPGIWRYPFKGKGGNGMTMMQPITESFLALDTWPDHNGVYLLINSCKKFDERQVLHWLEVDQGLVVLDSLSGSLGLVGAI
jgi:S-adenosylmethionine/arginine decarboxylase-like enzyme